MSRITSAKVSYHGSKGNGSRGVIVDRDEVDEEGRAADEGRQQESWHDHLPDPIFSAHPGIQTAAGVSVDRSRGGVNKDGRAQERSSSESLDFKFHNEF